MQPTRDILLGRLVFLQLSVYMLWTHRSLKLKYYKDILSTNTGQKAWKVFFSWLFHPLRKFGSLSLVIGVLEMEN